MLTSFAATQHPASPTAGSTPTSPASRAPRDVTELKKAQELALRSERLAAIGQMMTGLAHESGNALARSQSCLEMLAWEVEDRPEALELIDRIQKAQDHLQQLYEEVRSYAAPLRLERERRTRSRPTLERPRRNRQTATSA